MYPIFAKIFIPEYMFFPQEEDVEIDGVEFNVLRAFHHELRVDALAWSPDSRLDRIPCIRYICTCILSTLVAFKACKLELISQPEINLVDILSCNQKGGLR